MDLFEQFRLADAVKAVHYSSGGGIQPSPIFSLKKFEWDKKVARGPEAQGRQRLIQDVAVSNNVVIIATTNCVILRWNAMDANREPERIEVPVTAANVIKATGSGSAATIDSPDSIERVFIDPTANHVIIAMKSTDNYYLHSRSQRPKKLSRLQGVIECIAFDRHNCTESATRSFLAGTSIGVIYEISVDSSGKEKLCQPVYQLEQPLPISSIYFDYIGSSTGSTGTGAPGSAATAGSGLIGSSTFTAAANAVTSGGIAGSAGALAGGISGGPPGSDVRFFVMWSTACPTRLYHLTGGPTLLALFSAYLESGTTSFTELPALSTDGTSAGNYPVKRAQLLCYTTKGFGGAYASSSVQGGSSGAQHFALMTEMGIYHGSLLFSNAAASNAE